MYIFDENKFVEIVDFAENLFIPDIDCKLKLLPYHKFVYANLFGWVHKLDNSRRRFRSGYVEVARKNSKTTSFLFPIILYDFLYTKAAESFFVSRDLNQSHKSFTELRHIVSESCSEKTLRKLNITESFGIRMNDGSFLNFFSSETRGTDSYKNSMAVIDEFHAYDNDKIITSFRYGGRARKNNLVLIITSAGTDISGPCYKENEKARKVLNGVLTDDSYFTIIFAYDETDDWKDTKLFIKANPSLGEIVKQDILENDLKDALITPSHQSDFKAKTCGIWTNNTTNWIPLQKWDTIIRNKEIDINDFKGQTCFGGLDLSSINDFTVFSLCFAKDGLYYLFHKFYVPSEQVQEKYRIENINIKEWIDSGIVTAIPGSTIDYEYVGKDIIDAAEQFNLTELAYDRWNSNKLIDKLDDLIPNTILVQYDQSLKQMSNPSKQFEKLIYEDKIIDSNPVMKWMISNAVVKPDINGNFKPFKEFKSSTNRIDGVITSIMCIDRCNQNEAPVILQSRDFNKVLNLFN
jgi:phage terminase large subunit-like protein